MTGILINFEGVDGTGKKTQTELLKNELMDSGYKVAVYSYPDYNSDYGKTIEAFLNNQLSIDVKDQFFLYIFDMIKDKKQIEELRNQNYVVILDRYFLSTIAYQCANGFNYADAKRIIELSKLPYPDIIFYCQMPIAAAQERKSLQKGKVDKFEEDDALLMKVANLYEEIVKDMQLNSRWIEVNAQQKTSIIHSMIMNTFFHMSMRRGIFMNEVIKTTIKELEELSEKQEENEKVLKEKLKILFKEYCLKEYLNECEPAYCVFRITNSCEYIKILNKLYGKK